MPSSKPIEKRIKSEEFLLGLKNSRNNNNDYNKRTLLLGQNEKSIFDGNSSLILTNLTKKSATATINHVRRISHSQVQSSPNRSKSVIRRPPGRSVQGL